MTDDPYGVIAQLEKIANEAAAQTRRRLAADLAQFDVDENALNLAIYTFDDVLWSEQRRAEGDEGLCHDGQVEALLAAIKVYIAECGR